MSKLTLRHIGKQYDGKVDVIRDVNLEIRDGEFMVFVGPSGCGKSTLLRMIAGLEDITRGHLMIDDRRVNDIPAAKRGISMVFQSYALYPHMTVFDNMAFGLKLAGVARTEIDEAVNRAADILKLTPLLQRYPKALSGGQRQRVAIGRAIVRKPGVFLFDEPLSNLDAALRVQMRIELARLHKELGVTMIYVTHDQVEAMTLGDRIAVFNAGNIEQVGTPLELYQRPANRFVATFIGSPSMNILPGAFGPDRAAHAGSIGIRAEHVELGTAGSLDMRGRVTLVEHLGDSAIAYVEVMGHEQPVAVKLDAQHVTCAAGQEVGLRLPGQHLHVFDSAGAALC